MKNYPMRRRNFGLDFFNDDFFSPFFDFNSNRNMMKTDVKEENGTYKLEVEMPGLDKKDINLTLEDGYLTICAKKNESKEEKEEGNYIRRERSFGSCSRSYYVGDIEEKDINASYENGILKIDFPKEKVKKIEEKKRIDIK